MASGSSALTNSSGRVDRSVVEQIVRQVALEYLGRERAGRSAGEAPVLTVMASARHMHVCREDMDILFGPGTELTVYKDLYQAGNFAANEKVTIIGPRSRLISNLRILGPMRKQSQIELAFTDAISLGFDDHSGAALRQHRGNAGRDHHGAEGDDPVEGRHHSRRDPRTHEPGRGGLLRGEAGRHDEAAQWAARPAPRSTTYIVRIDPTSRLNVHMDTDEANACGLHLTKDIELLK